MRGSVPETPLSVGEEAPTFGAPLDWPDGTVEETPLTDVLGPVEGESVGFS